MRANLQIRDEMQAIKIMVYPFIEQMETEIEQANGNGTKQMIADVAVSVFKYLKENNLLSATDVQKLEGFDIPLLEMYANGVKMYPVE